MTGNIIASLCHLHNFSNNKRDILLSLIVLSLLVFFLSFLCDYGHLSAILSVVIIIVLAYQSTVRGITHEEVSVRVYASSNTSMCNDRAWRDGSRGSKIFHDISPRDIVSR
jgi:hypothetical protein